jgi:hypothetical protein
MVLADKHVMGNKCSLKMHCWRNEYAHSGEAGKGAQNKQIKSNGTNK